MNRLRAIKGFFLSLVFLSVIFLGLQKMWEITVDGSLLLGSVSGSENALNGETYVNPDPPKPYRNWDVPDFSLQAKSALAMEISLGENSRDKALFSKNVFEILPMASLTKLMTAVVVLENYDLNKMITISSEAAMQEGLQRNLNQGRQMSAEDLLYIMLIESNNEAALALSEGMDYDFFIWLMNKKAKELGMEKTFYAEPTGLSAQNISTAQDLAKLGKYILEKHPEIADISKIKEYDLPDYGKLINTDELLGEIPDIVAGKTGFTIEASGCLLLILNNPKQDGFIIYVILGSGERFSEMKNLIEWINSAYVW